MIDLQVTSCRAGEIFDDPASAELFAEYAAECANPILGATAPIRELYESLESSGHAQCFAAYVDGKLCGCAFLLMSTVPHYRPWFGTVDSLFVLPRARTSGLGKELMSAVENHARMNECKAIFYSAPLNSRLARLLALSDKYVNTNLVFTKRLA